MPITSITSHSGRDFNIKAADPDVSPSVYATIGGVRTSEMTINNNSVDITNVSSEGFQEWDPDGGIQSITFNIDGIYDSGTQGAQNLYKAAHTRVLVEINVVSGHGDSIFAAAAVENYQRTGAHDGVEMFSCTLNSHNVVRFV